MTTSCATIGAVEPNSRLFWCMHFSSFSKGQNGREQNTRAEQTRGSVIHPRLQHSPIALRLGGPSHYHPCMLRHGEQKMETTDIIARNSVNLVGADGIEPPTFAL
jgi:hypothetical protein